MDGNADEELVEMFRDSGETRHFDELVARHIKKVRQMIYPMVLNDADADELTQEVFLRVVRHLDSFNAKSSFRTWLHRIVMNTTYSFLKKVGKAKVEIRSEVPELVAREGCPVDAVAANELDRDITLALSSLKPTLRAALTLVSIHGMTPSEAAQTEGCVVATMYWRVHEARRLLKEQLRRGVHDIG